MNYKKINKIEELERGDIVRHVSNNGFSYVVNANFGNRATATRTADITNPNEWEVLDKSNFNSDTSTGSLDKYPSQTDSF